MIGCFILVTERASRSLSLRSNRSYRQLSSLAFCRTGYSCHPNRFSAPFPQQSPALPAVRFIAISPIFYRIGKVESSSCQSRSDAYPWKPAVSGRTPSKVSRVVARVPVRCSSRPFHREREPMLKPTSLLGGQPRSLRTSSTTPSTGKFSLINIYFVGKQNS